MGIGTVGIGTVGIGTVGVRMLPGEPPPPLPATMNLCTTPVQGIFTPHTCLHSTAIALTAARQHTRQSLSLLPLSISERGEQRYWGTRTPGSRHISSRAFSMAFGWDLTDAHPFTQSLETVHLPGRTRRSCPSTSLRK